MNKKYLSDYPHLLKEWDYEKNKSVNPFLMPHKSNKKFWWKCNKGHSWNASPSDRVTSSTGCPYCSGNKVLSGFNDLATLIPDSLKFWDYEKNNKLLPNQVFPHSGKVVWWKCKNGHSYKQKIVDKTENINNCPICNGQKVEKGFNDFKSLNPLMSQEWDYEKNNPLTPEQITLKSNRKIWWKCKYGHSWCARPAHRVRDNSGCPVCSGRKVLFGFNDLFTKCPSLRKEWDYEKNIKLNPKDLYFASNKKVWWKCKNGHSWETAVRLRTINGYGCPYCCGNKISIGKNDIFSTNPELKEIWDFDKNFKEGIDPKKITINYRNKVWWKTPNGISYQQDPHHKKRSLNSKKEFATTVLVPGYNDFQTVNPDVAKEWHPTKNGNLKPNQVLYGSGKVVWWKCVHGHEFKTSMHERHAGRGCPICSSRRQTSLPEQTIYFYVKKLYPDAINRCKTLFNNKMELDIFIPSINYGIEFDGYWHNRKDSYQRDVKKYKLCKENNIKLIRVRQKEGKEIEQCLGYEDYDYSFFLPKRYEDNDLQNLVEQIIEHIDFGHVFRINCPIKIDVTNDKSKILEYLVNTDKSLATERPEIAKQWHPTKNGNLKPDMFSKSSHEKIWWICSNCGKEFQRKISDAARTPTNGCLCTKCGNKQGGKSFIKFKVIQKGSLEITNPEIAREWHPTKNGSLKPSDITAHHNSKVWWKCSKCGYSYYTKPTIRMRGIGCPHCGGRVPISGIDDLKTLYPEIMLDWDYVKNTVNPATIKPHHGAKVYWKCNKCGHEWLATPSSRVNGTKCPKCRVREKRNKTKK